MCLLEKLLYFLMGYLPPFIRGHRIFQIQIVKIRVQLAESCFHKGLPLGKIWVIGIKTALGFHNDSPGYLSLHPLQDKEIRRIHAHIAIVPPLLLIALDTELRQATVTIIINFQISLGLYIMTRIQKIVF